VAFFVEPVNSNTPYWGVLFGSISSAYIHARSILEYSPETRIEFSKIFIPSFFSVKKEFYLDAMLIGSSWTVSRFVTEKGLKSLGNHFFGSDEERRKKIDSIAITGSIFLSSFVSFGCLYLAQRHFSSYFPNNETKLGLGELFSSAMNLTNCIFVGYLATIAKRHFQR